MRRIRTLLVAVLAAVAVWAVHGTVEEGTSGFPTCSCVDPWANLDEANEERWNAELQCLAGEDGACYKPGYGANVRPTHREERAPPPRPLPPTPSSPPPCATKPYFRL